MTLREEPTRVDLGALAMRHLGTMAQRGVAPARLQRELATIVAAWREQWLPSEMLERIQALHAQLVEAAEEAAEQVGDVDRADVAALRQAAYSLAAVEAMRDGLAHELRALTEAGALVMV